MTDDATRAAHWKRWYDIENAVCKKQQAQLDAKDAEIARLTRENEALRAERDAIAAAAFEAAAELFRDANHGHHAMTAIRALTPADATAALNRVQAGAMREAAATPYDPRYTDDWLGMTCAILARADAVERGEA